MKSDPLQSRNKFFEHKKNSQTYCFPERPKSVTVKQAGQHCWSILSHSMQRRGAFDEGEASPNDGCIEESRSESRCASTRLSIDKGEGSYNDRRVDEGGGSKDGEAGAWAILMVAMISLADSRAFSTRSVSTSSRLSYHCTVLPMPHWNGSLTTLPCWW